MSAPEFISFLTQVLRRVAEYSIDGALHYICMDWRHLSEVLSAGAQVYAELKNICVWVKNHTGMGAFYRSRHEFILVYKHGRATHRNNIQLGKYGRDRTNVWMYPSPRTPSEEGNLLALHPTVKRVRMVADATLDCTARRYRDRPYTRKWHHPDRRRAHRSALFWTRARTSLRRYDCSALAGIYR